jgi:hypothetical protein
MSYRLNITKKELGDFIIMLFFDKFFDEELLQENEKFNDFFHKMESLELKGYIFKKYFDVEPNIRSKYKMFRRNFDDEGSNVNIFMKDSVDEEENLDYKELILETIKKVTGKENPDKEKINQFTNDLLNSIMENNETEEEEI